MGYRVGQFRRDQYSKNYTTLMQSSYNEDELSPQNSGNNNWKDAAMVLEGNNYFKKDKLYFLNVAIRDTYTVSQNASTKIIIKLKSTINSNEMIIGEYSWDFTYQIIFSPNNNNYNKIVFEIQRNQVDYLSNTPRILNLSQSNRKIFEVVDIIEEYLKKTYTNLSYLDKIGLQGPPGMLFTINGEQLRIGNAGYYELENIIISQIGFVPNEIDQQYKNVKNPLEYFILDFQY